MKILRIVYMLMLAFSIVYFITEICDASEISEKDAVHCILGEAQGEYRSQGIDAFIAIGEGIRNRGSKRGVYGCTANLSKDMPYLKAKGLVKEAKKAWRKSKTSNLIKNADHWESTDFKVPYWEEGKEIIAKIGKHIFYK